MLAPSIITGINGALVLSLLYVYGKNFVKTRSSFTVGLIVFAALFLLQNIVTFYFYITMMPYFAEGVSGFALVLSLLQMLAFIVLNWITWK